MRKNKMDKEQNNYFDSVPSCDAFMGIETQLKFSKYIDNRVCMSDQKLHQLVYAMAYAYLEGGIKTNIKLLTKLSDK